MYINNKLLIVFRLAYNRIDDREEANQGYGWCHYNTASTENISIERVKTDQKNEKENRS